MNFKTSNKIKIKKKSHNLVLSFHKVRHLVLVDTHYLLKDNLDLMDLIEDIHIHQFVVDLPMDNHLLGLVVDTLVVGILAVGNLVVGILVVDILVDIVRSLVADL